MTLLEQIKQESLAARKARDTAGATLLTTLLSEVSMVGKNANRETTEAEAIAVVKKFLKNNNDTLARITDSDAIAALQSENRILEKFIPAQLSGIEIKNELLSIITQKSLSGPKSMGALLQEFKLKHEGKYDGATASKFAKELLN